MTIVKGLDGVTRRQRLRLASVFGAGRVLSPSLGNPTTSAAQTPSVAGPGAARAGSFYESPGVRPLIHRRGTLTVIGGTMELSEVRAAIDRANLQVPSWPIMSSVERKIRRWSRHNEGIQE